MQPVVIMLVGLPASGKSTIRTKLNTLFPGVFNNVSIDDYIEDVMAREGKRYREVFDANIWNARVHTDTEIELLTEAKMHVIWEGANLKASARRKKLTEFDGYHKIALIAEQPDQKEWERRLEQAGKEFPISMLLEMERTFVYPTKDEGFDRVFKLSQEQRLVWHLKEVLGG